MGVSGLRSVTSRPCIVVQESAVYQGTFKNVLADPMGIFEKLRFLGCVCDDIRRYNGRLPSVLVACS